MHDKVIHYLLPAAGAVAASILHRLADYIGWDVWRWLKRRTGRKENAKK